MQDLNKTNLRQSSLQMDVFDTYGQFYFVILNFEPNILVQKIKVKK